MPRQRDGIWAHFTEKSTTKTGCRAICNKCKKEIQGLVARMKIHYEKCKNDIPESRDDVEVVGKLLKLLFTKQTKKY